MTSFYDDRAADTLADREQIVCQHCAGRGWVEGDTHPVLGIVEVLVCRGCDGDGVLDGWWA